MKTDAKIVMMMEIQWRREEKERLEKKWSSCSPHDCTEDHLSEVPRYSVGRQGKQEVSAGQQDKQPHSSRFTDACTNCTISLKRNAQLEDN